MDPLHLRSAGTSLVISFDSGEAEVIHWGADLGSTLPSLAILTAAIPPSSADATVPAGLLPQASSSWRGRPALRGHRIADGVSGLDFSARLRVVSASVEGNSAVVVQADSDTGLTVFVLPDTARRRPAGTAPHAHQPRHHPLPARRTGHRPPGGAGRRRTPGPDRALVPGTPPAAPPHPAGHLGPHGPPWPHRTRLLAALRRRHCRISATATGRSGPPTWPGAATTNSSRTASATAAP